uniref:Uncharacterized protein n=1 Tax=Melanopsichium pennsylvanicum 4 TaxID=1398559 RepID=A0A077R273_9BASI|nr:uncharacterized protein BN887_06086 [Melanopsichium pennsylvanicum 4]
MPAVLSDLELSKSPCLQTYAKLWWVKFETFRHSGDQSNKHSGRRDAPAVKADIRGNRFLQMPHIE